MSVLFAIILFSLLIFVHELGHFLTAKASGVQVNEFSLFMGPVLWQKQIGQTLYSLRCIPIGGYCAMEGEEGDSDDPHSFGKAAWWKRAIILVAGAAMNYLMGLLLLAVFFAPQKQFVTPVVSEIEPGCALAGEQGIQEGDLLLAIDGEKIYTAADFSFLLSLNPGDVHDLLLERGGEKILLEDFSMEKREFPEADGTPSLRYGFSFSVVDATGWEMAKYVWNTALNNARLVRLSLNMLLRGQAGIRDVGGPVMIVQQMAQVADESSNLYYAMMNLVYFGAFLAINLAVMNLLPIPALDGGRVVCLLLTTAVEALTHKKIDPKYEAYLHGAGMTVLMLLMALIMFKDIIFLFMR